MTTMTRAEYEELLCEAALRIHLLGCLEECGHMPIWSAEAMQADAAFQTLFNHLGLKVPAEEIPPTDVVSEVCS